MIQSNSSFALGSRLPIWIAIAGNALVATVAYSLFGWNSAGAHVAARSTARFSLLWFIVGFASPGLVRFRRLMLPRQARLIQSFVAAHMVHYTVVIVLGVLAADSMLRHPDARVILVVLLGFTLVAVVGLTADARGSRLRTIIQTGGLYIVFLIFFVDYLKHPLPQLRLFAVPLALALLLRWIPGSRSDCAGT